MTPYELVTSDDEFFRAVDTLGGARGDAAVDVERASGFRYSQRAYLVQVMRPGTPIYLLDPTAISSFEPLQAAIGDINWVFHAASQDLPSLRELGLVPPSIFDTELGARLAGWDRVGLAAVVERALGISLAKEHSAADWSTRPLPASWLDYAALDVAYLDQLSDIIRTDLAEQGKLDYAEQEFNAVLAREPNPPREEPWRRLSGLHKVRGATPLAIARALWESREALAQELDVAPGRLVPDRALVAAVLANPQTKGQLASLKEFTGKASRSELDRWWSAIEAGRADPTPPNPRAKKSDTLPPPKAWAQRNPEADRRLKLARASLEEQAQLLNMPVENLLTPEYVRRLAWDAPETTADLASVLESRLHDLGARPWQIGETIQRITGAFVEAAQAPAETTADPS